MINAGRSYHFPWYCVENIRESAKWNIFGLMSPSSTVQYFLSLKLTILSPMQLHKNNDLLSVTQNSIPSQVRLAMLEMLWVLSGLFDGVNFTRHVFKKSDVAQDTTRH